MAYHGPSGPRQMVPFGYSVHAYDGENQQFDDAELRLPQQTVLGPADTANLEEFFGNPDTFKGMDNFNFPAFGTDGKVESYEGMFNFNAALPPGTVNPANTLATALAPTYQTHNLNHNASLSSPMASFGLANHATEEPDVTGAASSLIGLSHGQAQHQALATDNNNSLSAGSWGSMLVQQPSYNMLPSGDNSQAGHRSSSGRQSASNHNFSADTSSNHLLSNHHLPFQIPQQYPQYHYQPQPQPQQQQRHQQRGNTHDRSLSLNTFSAGSLAVFPNAAHSAFSGAHDSIRPNMYRFGSDPNIHGDGYHAPGYEAQLTGKGHNLMDVPLAGLVANGSHVNAPQANQLRQDSRRSFHPQNTSNTSRGLHSSTSSPGGIGGLPFTSNNHLTQHQLSDQWAQMQQRRAMNSDHDDTIQVAERPRQNNKRRKSQAELDEEAEYQPQQHHHVRGAVPRRGPKVPKVEEMGEDEDDYDEYTPTKRTPVNHRKSVVRRASTSKGPSTPSDMASPDDGEPSSSRKKARQNLSEMQKRQNHILSEQKRRNTIKQSFADLNDIVPILNNGKSGLSKAEVLKEIVAYLEDTIDGNVTMLRNLNLSANWFDHRGSDDDEDAF